MNTLTHIPPAAPRSRSPQPGARTVLLLHASASSARQWQSLVDRLRPRWRVLTIDLHGHGDRPAWHGQRPLELADEAALAAAALAEWGGGHVVGHSYGGAVAFELACRHPELVRSLVAYEPVLFRLLLDDPPSRQLVRDIDTLAGSIRDRLAQGQDEEAARQFVNHWSGPDAWDEMTVGRRAAVVLRMPSVQLQYDALMRTGCPWLRLSQLRLPTLVLTGERTVPTTRRVAEVLRSCVVQGQHETLPRLAHMAPISHPEPFNQRVDDFLTSQLVAQPRHRGLLPQF